ncbi:hypothetical protein ACHAXS_012601 [Conticribra weissflogii]
MDKFCPGFMCVPQKPHPFGNEYHTICDGNQGRAILWRAEMVEGKDRPKKEDGKWAFPSAQALIKKHGQYWPCHVPGNKIDNYLAENELVSTMTY